MSESHRDLYPGAICRLTTGYGPIITCRKTGERVSAKDLGALVRITKVLLPTRYPSAMTIVRFETLDRLYEGVTHAKWGYHLEQISPLEQLAGVVE